MARFTNHPPAADLPRGMPFEKGEATPPEGFELPTVEAELPTAPPEDSGAPEGMPTTAFKEMPYDDLPDAAQDALADFFDGII